MGRFLCVFLLGACSTEMAQSPGGGGGSGGGGAGGNGGGGGTLWPACGSAGGSSGALVAGGLTALPPPAMLGPTLAQNGDFEAAASGWSVGTAWTADTAVHHGGAASLRMVAATTASQHVMLHQGIYKLSGWMKTDNLGGGGAGLRFSLDFRPGVQEWNTTAVISGTTDWTYYERPHVVVPADRAASIEMEVYGHPSGTAWVDDVKLQEELSQPLDAFLLSPSYRGMMFEDEPGVIRLDVTVADAAGKTLVATLSEESSGREVARRELAAGNHTIVELDGCTMTAGVAHLATVALTRGGQTLYQAPPYRVSRVPAAARPGMNVSFDARNRILLHGTPRFILGVYDSGLGYVTTDQQWEDLLWSPAGDRRLTGLPINLYLNYWYGAASISSMDTLAANLDRHGVMYLQTGNCVTSNPASGFAVDTDSYVQQFGALAGAAGYYTADECDNSMMPGVFDQYTRLRGLDPDSITFAALLGKPPDVFLWRDAADVLSTDPYPMYGAEPAGGYNHGMVAEWTGITRDAVKDARPFLTVLQFFQFTSLGRWPTRAEMRNHAYMAIVEGARGLFWWSIGTHALADVCGNRSLWCPERTQHMDDLKAVMTEIAGLEPALLADEAPGALASVSSAAIRTRVKQQGKTYLFTYNATAAPQDASFVLTAARGVTVVGENRTLAPANHAFGDHFGPFEAHVYQIE